MGLILPAAGVRVPAGLTGVQVLALVEGRGGESLRVRCHDGGMAGKRWSAAERWALERTVRDLRRFGKWDPVRRDWRRHLAALAVVLGRTYPAVRKMASRRGRATG